MPGGRSPLRELTEAQARRPAPGARWRAARALPVFIGMRNWHPFLHETLAAMAARGQRRALGIILSSFRTEASWDRYQADVAAARERTRGAPEVVFAPPWFEHPRFVAAVADRRRPGARTEVPPPSAAETPIVFTAHSVPVAMAEASPYVADFTAAARAAVAARLGHARWSLAYQSRSGSPRDPWLEPDVRDVHPRAAADRAPPRRRRRRPASCAITSRSCTTSTSRRAVDRGRARRDPASRPRGERSPEFIAMLADLVRAALESERAVPSAATSPAPPR